MKKLLIGSFVGAILLFGWQAISWTVAGVHDNAYKYVSGQDTIINYLTSHLAEDGEYLVPRSNPKLSKEEQMKEKEAMMSRPWALINFHPAYESNMGKTMAIGFINCFICVLLACLVIRKFDTRYKKFFSLFTSVLTFGVICFLFVWYNQHNWFQTTWNVLWGELVDNFVGWGLAGVWLAWWYGK
ncbi:MAG: hypothetical protein ABIN89_06405 [Chitinophagaceae bacterium]